MQHSSILIIGSRNHNKTNLIKDICKKEFDQTIVINPTFVLDPTSVNFYKNNFNNTIIEEQYNNDIIKTLLEKQKTEKQNTLLILDDCLSQCLSFLTDTFEELIFAGRDYNITTVINIQYPIRLSPEIRSSFNQVYLYGCEFVLSRRKFYEHYCNFFPTFAEFDSTFSNFTNDGIMAIDYTTHPTNYYKKVIYDSNNNTKTFVNDSNKTCNYFSNFINKFSCF